MRLRTGKALVGANATRRQTREAESYWNLLATTVLCWRIHLENTEHPEDGHGTAQMELGYRNQIDYIMVRRCFLTSVNTAETRSFPGADIGSGHDLVVMTFWFRLKKIKMKDSTRIKKKNFDLEKLKDPQVAEAFLA